MYFTDNGVGRGAMMIIDPADAGQIAHVTEPLMLAFDASVDSRIAMSPEDLMSAGIEPDAEK